MAVWGLGVINNVINWGRGAFNNLISWGIVQKTSPAGDTEIYGLRQDTDVTAFLTVTGITDATITSALDTLATDLKGYGIWDKMKAIYPFVGGTPTTHKFNLKDARDLDAAFRLAFNGGWTHSSNGALPNGTNGYANTFLNQLNNLGINNNHISYYSRTNSSGNIIDCGVTDNATYATSFIRPLNLGNATFENGSQIVTASNSSSIGYFIGTSLGISKLFKNSTLLGSSSTTQTRTMFNDAITLGALKVANGTFASYSNRQFAFASIGDGLTDTEASNLYLAVQKFQTTLNRQV